MVYEYFYMHKGVYIYVCILLHVLIQENVEKKVVSQPYIYTNRNILKLPLSLKSFSELSLNIWKKYVSSVPPKS